MFANYSRPKTIDEAITILKNDKTARPMAGGTSFRQLARLEDIHVVDLQDVGLKEIRFDGDWVEIGAMATLNVMAESAGVAEAIKAALQLEGTNNTRNMATIGGRLNAVDGRSALIAVLIAMDAITIWDEGRMEFALGEWMAMPEKKPGKLLLGIKYRQNVNICFEVLNKTKLDLPILCVAAARWKSGRTRVALGGFGKVPGMVFDGPDSSGAESAAVNACANSTDAFASSIYRQEMALTLTRRCLSKIEEQ